MKLCVNVIGCLMIAVGAFWLLEGLKLAPGAVFIPFIKLSGTSWAGNGAWLAVFGIGLLVWNNKAPNKV